MQNQTITLESTRFGSVEIPSEAVVDFPAGLIGLGGRRYAIVARDEDATFVWLHSLEDPDLALGHHLSAVRDVEAVAPTCGDRDPRERDEESRTHVVPPVGRMLDLTAVGVRQTRSVFALISRAAACSPRRSRQG